VEKRVNVFQTLKWRNQLGYRNYIKSNKNIYEGKGMYKTPKTIRTFGFDFQWKEGDHIMVL